VTRKIIKTDKAPAAIGPYSQAVAVQGGGLLFTAGQIPMDPETGTIVGAAIEEQARQALTNLRHVLEAGGASMETAVKTTVFLKDMNDFAAMNQVYNEFFGTGLPARSAVEAARLPKDVLVEIECIAHIQ